MFIFWELLTYDWLKQLILSSVSVGHHHDTTIVCVAYMIEYFINGFDIIVYIIMFSYVKTFPWYTVVHCRLVKTFI